MNTEQTAHERLTQILAAAFCRRLEDLREQSNGTGYIGCTWDDKGVTAACGNGKTFAATGKPEASIRGAIEAALAGMV